MAVGHGAGPGEAETETSGCNEMVIPRRPGRDLTGQNGGKETTMLIDLGNETYVSAATIKEIKVRYGRPGEKRKAWIKFAAEDDCQTYELPDYIDVATFTNRVIPADPKWKVAVYRFGEVFYRTVIAFVLDETGFFEKPCIAEGPLDSWNEDNCAALVDPSTGHF